MEAGPMDRRITIQQNTGQIDDYGQEIPQWSDLDEIWSQVVPLRGNERYAAQQPGALSAMKFAIRYRSDVTEQMRILYDGRYYDITYIEELGRQDGLMLHAEFAEGVPV